MNKTCSIPTCGRPAKCRGYCATHYSRLWKYGDSMESVPVEKRAVNPSASGWDRFWGRVSKSGDNDCWLWTGQITAGGYGRLKNNGRPVLAHRFSFTLNRGPIPDGMKVCHTCDNRACVNPNHFFLGTQLDNIQDRHRKGRDNRPSGERSSTAKLKNHQVLEIRERSAKGETRTALGREYGVCHTGISGIVLRKTWRHI